MLSGIQKGWLGRRLMHAESLGICRLCIPAFSVPNFKHSGAVCVAL